MEISKRNASNVIQYTMLRQLSGRCVLMENIKGIASNVMVTGYAAIVVTILSGIDENYAEHVHQYPATTQENVSREWLRS